MVTETPFQQRVNIWTVPLQRQAGKVSPFIRKGVLQMQGDPLCSLPAKTFAGVPAVERSSASQVKGQLCGTLHQLQRDSAGI